MALLALLVLALLATVAHSGVPHTVSGLSSGAYAAVQYHVAYSSSVEGAGIVAGGPYWCAMDNAAVALNACMTSPSYISLSTLYAATDYAEAAASIDSTSNLANDRVYLFSGTLDTVVDQGVMVKLLGYYGHYISDPKAIKYNFNVSAVHGMVTDSFGNPCADFASPFIINCNFDLVGEMFAHIFPNGLNARTTPVNSNIITLNQGDFVPVTHDPSTYSLYQTAYAYIPTSCQPSSRKAVEHKSNNSVMCAVHVAFHGCEQTVPDIGMTYVLNAGYNQWAESNAIIILYPQAIATTLNPKGCFDWWGYTGPAYATKLAVQNIAVNGMVDWLFNKYN